MGNEGNKRRLRRRRREKKAGGIWYQQNLNIEDLRSPLVLILELSLRSA